jgi:RNA polymerase sigma factor (sigma-70 family)
MSELTPPRESLALISTDWPTITDPMKFVLRYAPAIRGYLRVLLPQAADVDEVLQEILLGVLERGFTPDRVRRGRFRDYLIAAIRYSAMRNLRRKKAQQLSDQEAADLADVSLASPPEAQWLADWRQCLLDWAWAALERKQRRSPGNWHYTVLKLATDHPGATSMQLAPRVPTNRPLSPEAFRKQLSRARAAFARALVDEVERTIDRPTMETVLDELADVGLLEYVRPYLKKK